MKKKSQMEIMGLAIIVILLTLGLLFFIKVIISKEPSTSKQSFTQTKTAANMVDVMVKTTTKNCHGTEIRQLLQDCAENHNNPNSLIQCENGETSCRYVNSTIEYLFNHTLRETTWGNQSFYFSAYTDENNPILEQGKRCPPGSQKAEPVYIPTRAGNLQVWLFLC